MPARRGEELSGREVEEGRGSFCGPSPAFPDVALPRTLLLVLWETGSTPCAPPPGFFSTPRLLDSSTPTITAASEIATVGRYRLPESASPPGCRRRRRSIAR